MGSFPGEVTLARGKEIAIQCTVVVVGFAEQKLFLLLRQKNLVMGISHIVNVIKNFAFACSKNPKSPNPTQNASFKMNTTAIRLELFCHSNLLFDNDIKNAILDGIFFFPNRKRGFSFGSDGSIYLSFLSRIHSIHNSPSLASLSLSPFWSKFYKKIKKEL